MKGCEEVAKQFNMLIIKVEDHKHLLDNVSKVSNELEQLQKTIDTKCASIQLEEKNKYEQKLKYQTSTQELNHKAETADMKAQIDQQKREVDMLYKTIENLKHEISEQRTLTKEVAQASSKSQISQKFGKD